MVLLNSLSVWQWAIALAVPVGIILLYFLRLKRRPLEVPSTFLWKKSIEDLRVNSLWQRLRRNILLLLQLLVVAALLLALLRPAWNVAVTGDRIVLVIDQSASMATHDVKPHRLGEAKRRALELVDQMQGADAAMIIAFADSARVVSSYTSEKGTLRQAIDSIEQTDRPTNIREALLIASAMLHPADKESAATTNTPEATLYLLSDGRFADVDDISLKGMKTKYLRVGTSVDNVGIMSLSAVPRASDPEKRDIVARIQSFKDEPTKVSAELRVDGERIDLRGVDLSPNSSSMVTFPYTGSNNARVSLQLAPADDFAVDDVAYAVVSPPVPVRILYVGPENPPLEAALATPSVAHIAEIERRPLSEVDRPIAGGSDDDRFDLVIFDRCRPKVMPSANTFFIGTIPVEMEAKKLDAKGPVILAWESSNPLLQFLNLDDVNLFEASLISPSDSWKSLIETDKGLVLASMSRGAFIDLVLTIPLVDDKGAWQTDWPLKPSFPLFIMNVIRTLGGTKWHSADIHRTGNPIIFQPRRRAESTTMELPDGSIEKLRPGDDGTVEFLDTNRTGFYRWRVGDESQTVPVNLFDDNESRIAAAEDVRLGTSESKDVSRDYKSRLELWKWLALAGLGLLVLEWYIYNRRVYV
ncbi:BatA and WFA domain-containing protein [bacterium]|nr:BatA and WFA domain-containing protein [bacterium]